MLKTLVLSFSVVVCLALVVGCEKKARGQRPSQPVAPVQPQEPTRPPEGAAPAVSPDEADDPGPSAREDIGLGTDDTLDTDMDDPFADDEDMPRPVVPTGGDDLAE